MEKDKDQIKIKRKKRKKLVSSQVGRTIGIVILAGSFGLYDYREAQHSFPDKHLHPEINIAYVPEIASASIMTAAGTTTLTMAIAGMTTMTYLKF